MAYPLTCLIVCSSSPLTHTLNVTYEKYSIYGTGLCACERKSVRVGVYEGVCVYEGGCAYVVGE